MLQGGEKAILANKDDRLLNKYASLIGVPAIENKKLYAFIDSWYGTKYKYGGMTKAGVDCSGFCNILYKEVYKWENLGVYANYYRMYNPLDFRN